MQIWISNPWNFVLAVSLAGIPPATIKCGFYFSSEFKSGEIATAFIGTSYLNYLNNISVCGSKILHPSFAAVANNEKSLENVNYLISPSWTYTLLISSLDGYFINNNSPSVDAIIML